MTTLKFVSLHRFSRIEIGRLARPPDLKGLLLVALAVQYVLGYWKTHPQPIFWLLSGQWTVVVTSIDLSVVKSSRTLSRKMAPKHNVSTFVLDCGDGNVWVILSLHTQGVELMPKSLILASSDHSTFSQAFSESFRCSLANLRRTCTCAFLSRVTLRALRSSVLGDCGPNCLQINNKLLP